MEPIDITGARLETPRLVLREWRETDLEDCYEYASAEGVGEMAGWRHHGDRAETARILGIFIEGKNVWAVTLRESGKVIGSVGLHPSWTDDTEEYAGLQIREIGYVLSRDYWGRGLMPEAVKAVIGCCFERFGLDALTVGHFVSNAQSARVIEKCGFTYVKTGVFHAKQLGADFDEKLYLLRKEQAR